MSAPSSNTDPLPILFWSSLFRELISFIIHVATNRGPNSDLIITQSVVYRFLFLYPHQQGLYASLSENDTQGSTKSKTFIYLMQVSHPSIGQCFDIIVVPPVDNCRSQG